MQNFISPQQKNFALPDLDLGKTYNALMFASLVVGTLCVRVTHLLTVVYIGYHDLRGQWDKYSLKAHKNTLQTYTSHSLSFLTDMFSHPISISNALWLLLWHNTVDAGRQGRRKHSAQERIEKNITGLQNMLVCHSHRKQTYNSSCVETPRKVYSKPFAFSLLEENQCTPRRIVTTTYSDLDLKERRWFVLIHCAF